MADGELTYPDVGATRDARLPAGYNHLRYATTIGRGRDVFAAAGAAVLDWRMHRASGVLVCSSARAAKSGADLEVSVGVGRLRIVAPCRVVWAEQGDRRIGFAYGTRQGHPECGEESFVVTLLPDDCVAFAVTAFSAPARWYTRLGGPLVPVFQRMYARRLGYVLRRLARNGG